VKNESMHDGYPCPSDTYDATTPSTSYPRDVFTDWVTDDKASETQDAVANSYYSDGNMEAYRIAGPYAAANEASTDVGAFTGATGPSGHVTPSDRPFATMP